jgi:hypothetical protein
MAYPDVVHPEGEKGIFFIGSEMDEGWVVVQVSVSSSIFGFGFRGFRFRGFRGSRGDG